MAQKYLFIAILCIKMSHVNKALSIDGKFTKSKKNILENRLVFTRPLRALIVARNYLHTRCPNHTRDFLNPLSCPLSIWSYSKEAYSNTGVPHH